MDVTLVVILYFQQLHPLAVVGLAHVLRSKLALMAVRVAAEAEMEAVRILVERETRLL